MVTTTDLSVKLRALMQTAMEAAERGDFGEAARIHSEAAKLSKDAQETTLRENKSRIDGVVEAAATQVQLLVEAGELAKLLGGPVRNVLFTFDDVKGMFRGEANITAYRDPKTVPAKKPKADGASDGTPRAPRKGATYTLTTDTGAVYTGSKTEIGKALLDAGLGGTNAPYAQTYPGAIYQKMEKLPEGWTIEEHEKE